MPAVVLFIVCIIISIGMGKLVSLVKMPAILGWLITGMILGPHAFGLISENTLDSAWLVNLNHLAEVCIGLLIGSELIWKRIKKSGKQIIIMTLTESMGTFVMVTIAFAVCFYFSKIPLYIAPIMGAISLATAPAPSLAIVSEYKASGPVTNTLIPLAVLDDVVGMIVFFTVMGITAVMFSGAQVPFYFIPVILLTPIAVGVALGFLASILLNRIASGKLLFAVTCICIAATAVIGIFINEVLLPRPIMNLMLMGVSYFTVIANRMEEEKFEKLNNSMGNILRLAMIVIILNLAAPLDYHLILGAGLFTFIYIFFRAAGKIGGAWIGAFVSKAPGTVRKFLGLTLLPHSGVSLLFTGIAVTMISKFDATHAIIIQGTIAAAAVINEIIAVFVARAAFKASGELGKGAAE